MNAPEGEFKKAVYELVAQIPKGRVMSYGQIAVLCGRPYAARMVGGIAHFGDPKLPWQRVVMKDGGLATGYPGGTEGHKADLLSEGVRFIGEYQVDMAKHSWLPDGL